MMEIEGLKKKYRNEWLLIRVEKTDKLNRPTAGKLITRSRNRDDVYEKMKKTKGHTYTVYSGKIPRKGYAVAF